MAFLTFLFGEQWKESINHYYVHFIVGFLFAGAMGVGAGFTATGSILSNSSEQTAGIVLLGVSAALLILFVGMLYVSDARSVFGPMVIMYFIFGYCSLIFTIAGAILISKGDDETYVGLNIKAGGYFCLAAAALSSAAIYLVMKCPSCTNRCTEYSTEYSSI